MKGRLVNQLSRTWTWIRSDPRRTAAAGAAAVAAVAAGVAMGVLVANIRPDAPIGSAPSASPTVSVRASQSASPSVPTSGAPSPSPDASPSASTTPPAESPDASATPAVTAAPTPTPPEGIGGVTDPEPEDTLEGTWERLADMPDGDGYETADSLVLPDGRIAVFRWQTDIPTPESAVVAIYDPQADAWTPVTFDDDVPAVGTDQSFVLGNDERIYTYDYRIRIDGDAWSTEPFELVRETETWAGMSLASGSDGRIYRVADDTGPERTELVIFDPGTETFERSAEVDGKYAWIVAVGDRLAAFGYDGDHEGAVIFYDAQADGWSEPQRIDYGTLDMYSLAADPDGFLYGPGWNSSSPSLWAFDVDDGSAMTVELPDDLDADSWSVDLVWHDDALYAFGRGEAWRFTPES